MNTVQNEEYKYAPAIISIDSYSMGFNAAMASEKEELFCEDGTVDVSCMDMFNTDYVNGFTDGVLEQYPDAVIKSSETVLLS